MTPDYPTLDELFRDVRAGEAVPCNLVVEECPENATHVVEERPADGVCDGHYFMLKARAGFHRLNGGPLSTGRPER